MKLEELNVKIYSDGADLDSFSSLCNNPIIKGFTTNPTLMRKAGIQDYAGFANQALKIVKGKPISFEVFTDELDEMLLQAQTIASWGDNINVKIPVSNSKGVSTYDLVGQLSSEGIIVNVTAVFTDDQIKNLVSVIDKDCPAIISVFAGRIADTGRDAITSMQSAVMIASSNPNIDILWASTREPFNIIEAERAGCDIITVPPDMIKKAESFFDKDLEQFSIETVKMFYDDAVSSGYMI